MDGNKKIIVIGAGPAGMMAAIRAADFEQEVVLVEKNKIPGRKLLLSGKGRCNLTNACDLDAFLKRFYGQGDFLRDAFKKFFISDLMRFFEERGVQLKVERQERVFPVTDRSHSIADILKKELERKKVKVLYSRSVLDIRISEGRVSGVGLDNGVV
ncbi:MAG: NAD(P)/FAD-dependent oxidoreductase, partial [Candidatus Omnitrophica bacterium]|nr:NAD(P)/FAD-dependent oxidoreductase [Candidatus Omnitrophota bacterium]